jgi:exonuclease SbcC
VQHYKDLFQKEAEIEIAYQHWQKIAAELKEMDVLSANFNEQYRQRTEHQLIIEKEKSRLEQQFLQLSEGDKQVKVIIDAMPSLYEEQKRNLEEKEELEKKLSSRTELENDLQKLNEKQADLKAENNRLRSNMSELKERIDRLKASTGAECPLCGQSLEIDDRLRLTETLEKQGKEMGDQHRENEKSLREAQEEQQNVIRALSELDVVQKQLRDTQRQVDQASDKILQLENTISDWQKHGEPELRKITDNLQKEMFAQEARANLEIIDAKLKDLGYDPSQHEALRKQVEVERTAADQLHELEKHGLLLNPSSVKRKIHAARKRR